MFGKIDYAPKLFSIPHRVESIDSTPESRNFLVNQSIGMVVLGSFISTNIFVGILSPIIGKLQAQDGMVDLSLRSLAESAADIFGRIVKETGRTLAEDSLGQIVLIGHCPLTLLPQAWQITLQLEVDHVATKSTS